MAWQYDSVSVYYDYNQILISLAYVIYFTFYFVCGNSHYLDNIISILSFSSIWYLIYNDGDTR
jgi:hypothetical protein